LTESSACDTEKSASGFALIEMLVAMTIMALVGLMAWHGMDTIIRGREIIDRHSNEMGEFKQLVRQFEIDCAEIIRTDEIGTPSISAGAKNIWWLRKYRADNIDSWLAVGYGMSTTGLQRWVSKPLVRSSDAIVLWAGISHDPDLVSSEMHSSLELKKVVRQSFQTQSMTASGALSSAQQRGITMRWWLDGVALPIARSCLIGASL